MSFLSGISSVALLLPPEKATDELSIINEQMTAGNSAF